MSGDLSSPPTVSCFHNERVLLAFRIISAVPDAVLAILGIIAFLGNVSSDFFEFCNWFSQCCLFTIIGTIAAAYEVWAGPTTRNTFICMACVGALIGFCIISSPTLDIMTGTFWDVTCLTFGVLAWCAACVRGIMAFTAPSESTKDEGMPLLASRSNSMDTNESMQEGQRPSPPAVEDPLTLPIIMSMEASDVRAELDPITSGDEEDSLHEEPDADELMLTETGEITAETGAADLISGELDAQLLVTETGGITAETGAADLISNEFDAGESLLTQTAEITAETGAADLISDELDAQVLLTETGEITEESGAADLLSDERDAGELLLTQTGEITADTGAADLEFDEACVLTMEENRVEKDPNDSRNPFTEDLPPVVTQAQPECNRD